MSSEPIYFDHAATTPVLPQVAARMAEVLAMGLGNPAADHPPGRTAHALIEQARAQVAGLLGCEPADILFTSGATESNNLAITGTALATRASAGGSGSGGGSGNASAGATKPHLVSLATEHR